MLYYIALGICCEAFERPVCPCVNLVETYINIHYGQLRHFCETRFVLNPSEPRVYIIVISIVMMRMRVAVEGAPKTRDA